MTASCRAAHAEHDTQVFSAWDRFPNGALLQALRTRRIDVLLAELATDDSSGPALARLLRKQHLDLEAVYFARAGTRECEGVLVRPFTRDDLLRSVAAVALAR